MNAKHSLEPVDGCLESFAADGQPSTVLCAIDSTEVRSHHKSIPQESVLALAITLAICPHSTTATAFMQAVAVVGRGVA